MGMSTRPAKTIEKFTADNIRKLRVLFQPETKVAQDGSRTRTMITGARVKEWGGSASGEPATGSSGSGSGSTSSGGQSGTTGDGEGGREGV